VLVRAAQVNTYGPGQSSRRRYALVRQSGTAGLEGGSFRRVDSALGTQQVLAGAQAQHERRDGAERGARAVGAARFKEAVMSRSLEAERVTAGLRVCAHDGRTCARLRVRTITSSSK
jgi:hypothetical protein